MGGRARAIPTDVARDAFGRIDVLVNNAGYGHYAAVENLATADLEATLRTNLYGSVWCAKFALAAMKPRGRGHIVNVSTIVAERAVPFMSAYCMAKFALNAFDESLGLEAEPLGVRVHLVCPGLTKTDFRAHATRADGAPEVSAAAGMPATEVAAAILRAVRAGNGAPISPARAAPSSSRSGSPRVWSTGRCA